MAVGGGGACRGGIRVHEGIPPWIHDRYAASDVERIASGEEDLVNRLDRLKNDPQVQRKLDKVLKEAYEKAYNETLDLDCPVEIESGEPPLNELPTAGMEDAVHHWEVSQMVLLPFKDLHEKSKTTSRPGHPYVKCQVCGKALELHVHWKFLATCGEQELLPSERLGILEEGTSSREG